MLDGHGRAIVLHCLNLSAWLIPEGYLVGEGSFAALTTSPSQIRQRLETLVGREKARGFWEQWARAFVDESDFGHFEQQGFNCVRLPLSYKTLLHDPASAETVLDEAGVAPVDRAVAWGAAHGIYVFLDLHDAPGGQSSLASVADVPSTDRVARLWEGPTAGANRRLTIALWRALAVRYASAPSVGGYDLLNEPDLPKGVAAQDLAALYGDIIVAIRAVDRSHLIVLEGNRFAHDFSMLEQPSDGNVMYEFHAYSFLNPTWHRPNQAALAALLELRSVTHKPLWLGEFGEQSERWQSEMVQLMQSNHIGWAVWPWKRIDLKNHHPVIETIEPPSSWAPMAGFLVGRWFAHAPSTAAAEQALADIVLAVQTEHCRHDPSLERILAGR